MTNSYGRIRNQSSIREECRKNGAIPEFLDLAVLVCVHARSCFDARASDIVIRWRAVHG